MKILWVSVALAAMCVHARADEIDPKCGVIHQEGVVRSSNLVEQKRIELLLPCDWTDDQMLAAWRHRPDPVWGCGGYNMANPGKPNC